MNKQQFKLQLRYISSVIFRVLPNIRYHLKGFSHLYESRQIKSYFKKVRTLQEYDLYSIFQKAGFDMSLVHQVRQEAKNVQETFLSQVNEFLSICTNRSKFLGLCKITQNELDFLNTVLPGQIFPKGIPIFTKPDITDVIDSVNLKASVGLPNPFVKKRDILADIYGHLSRFFDGTLSSNDIFNYPAALFTRLQIRSSGLKVRLVHAVHGLQQSLESFFFLYFKSGLTIDSCITLGLTQLEISDTVSKHKDFYTYSVDYKSWDRTRQPVLSVISFDIMSQCLPLTLYELKIFNTLRSLYLTLPSFHPVIELRRRYIGTVSGSGFTSLDNSICNLVLTNLLLYRYCVVLGIPFSSLNPRINVSGDDLILSTTIPLKFHILQSIALRDFGASMKLESEVSLPSFNKCSFLGSQWINGMPFRPEALLVATVLFGTGNFPMMSKSELFQSRFSKCLEILLIVISIGLGLMCNHGKGSSVFAS